ncbi:MAG: hypothetical protein M3081_14380 [Gemmatimonadota bacterium]|nr:hypothetical protein [Gemmatimonadota bacterium]
MTGPHERPYSIRDAVILVCAVTLGGIAAALLQMRLTSVLSAGVARDIAVAAGTAITGATHGRLSHRHNWWSVLAGFAVSAPIVYCVMRAVHAAFGS